MTNKISRELTELGFVGNYEIKKKRRLVAAVKALENTGKTHFSIVTPPGPIAFINLNKGLDGPYQKAQKKGKEIWPLTIKFPELNRRTMNDKNAMMDICMPLLENLENSVRAVYKDSQIKTLTVDTSTEHFDLIKYALHGRTEKILPRNYGDINKRFENVYKPFLEEDCEKSLILITKLKKQYVKSGKDSEGNDKDSWSGDYEMAGFSDMPYFVQGIITCMRRMPEEEIGAEFGIRVDKCRLNPDLQGMEFWKKECDFSYILDLIDS